MASSSSECAVLLSGGVDSAVAASLLRDTYRYVSAVWVDYGQPAATAERLASASIARHYGLEWHGLTIGGLSPPKAGEIPARNDMLITLARARMPEMSIALGVHAGTPYADSSIEWVQAWRRLLDVQYQGVVDIIVPLAELSKSEVFALASERSIPIDMTHSCEAGNTPCGACLSCADRQVANVGS